jgi:hypothetical protein
VISERDSMDFELMSLTMSTTDVLKVSIQVLFSDGEVPQNLVSTSHSSCCCSISCHSVTNLMECRCLEVNYSYAVCNIAIHKITYHTLLFSLNVCTE